MNDPLPPNPLALLLDQDKQKTRRTLIKEVAVYAGTLAIPVQIALADIPIDPPAAQLAEIFESLPRINFIGLAALDSAICANPLAGDVNGDCCVDPNDLQIMQSEWLSSSSSARSSLDSAYSYIPGPDSAGTRVYVDYLDFEILARDWGKCGLEEPKRVRSN